MIVGACAVAKLVGSAMIAASVSGGEASRRRPRRVFGILVNAPLATLLAIITLRSFAIGVLQVGAVVSVSTGMSGVFLGGFAVGEVVGGVLYGAPRGYHSSIVVRRRWHVDVPIPFRALASLCARKHKLCLQPAIGFPVPQRKADAIDIDDLPDDRETEAGAG